MFHANSNSHMLVLFCGSSRQKRAMYYCHSPNNPCSPTHVTHCIICILALSRCIIYKHDEQHASCTTLSFLGGLMGVCGRHAKLPTESGMFQIQHLALFPSAWKMVELPILHDPNYSPSSITPFCLPVRVLSLGWRKREKKKAVVGGKSGSPPSLLYKRPSRKCGLSISSSSSNWISKSKQWLLSITPTSTPVVCLSFPLSLPWALSMSNVVLDFCSNHHHCTHSHRMLKCICKLLKHVPLKAKRML